MEVVKNGKKFYKAHMYIRKKVGYVYLLLMFFTSAITTVMTKYLMTGGLNAFHILTYTSFIGLLVLVIINSRTGYKGPKDLKVGFKWLLLSAFTGFSLYELTFNIALQYMTVSQTIIIYYSHPIFLYFAGLLFLNNKEKRVVDIKVLIGIAVSFAGIYFVATGGKFLSFTLNEGLVFILISIFSITIFTILGKKKEIPERPFLFIGQAISLISGVIVLTLKGWWVVPDNRQIIYLIFIAVVYNLINMLFYMKTIQHLSVEKLSTLTYLSPIITSTLAIIILKEPILAATAIGLVLVIIGNLISNAKEI
ncbi:MAG: DMT family transporter [Ignavibacteriales bacterium]